MERLCVVFGAGEACAPRKKFKKTDLIIAADGGLKRLTAFGLTPDVVIGDFDSGDEPNDTPAFVIKLDRIKDETDMLAAVKVGLRREYRDFVIYGGVGGRLDHTVANFAVLRHLNNFGAHGYLVGEDFVCTVITDEKFSLPETSRGTVSVFAYGGAATGVCEKNLAYKLENAELSPDDPRGVSNETIGAGTGSISVKNGSLLIFFPRPL